MPTMTSIEAPDEEARALTDEERAAWDALTPETQRRCEAGDQAALRVWGKVAAEISGGADLATIVDEEEAEDG